MSYVQNLIDATGADTTDEQIEAWSASMCLALKARRNDAREQRKLDLMKQKHRTSLNDVQTAFGGLNLGRFAL